MVWSSCWWSWFVLECSSDDSPLVKRIACTCCSDGGHVFVYSKIIKQIIMSLLVRPHRVVLPILMPEGIVLTRLVVQRVFM